MLINLSNLLSGTNVSLVKYLLWAFVLFLSKKIISDTIYKAKHYDAGAPLSSVAV